MRIIFLRPVGLMTSLSLGVVCILLVLLLHASLSVLLRSNSGPQEMPSTTWPAFQDLEALRRSMQEEECKERRHFVYIKMIKCASETLAAIFRRFGYVRNLSFVLPIADKLYIGWPYVINETFFRVNKTREFHMLCDHAIYNEEAMAKLMPVDTAYITSIRHPYSQFKSLFRYYKLGEIVGIQAADPLTEYLSHLERYEAMYMSKEYAQPRYCIPDGLSMAKNSMSFNLGFPTGFPPDSKDMSRDSGAIHKWLQQIERNFELILLVEYLDESLVLLKRLMCWSTKDIIYFTKNVGQYNYKNEVNYHTNLNIYKNYSNVDFALYDHFEYIFWKKVSQQGHGFVEEVEHFKRVRLAFNDFCSSSEQPPPKTISFEATDWSEAFTLERSYCKLVEERLMDEVKHEYDQHPVRVVQPQITVFTC